MTTSTQTTPLSGAAHKSKPRKQADGSYLVDSSTDTLVAYTVWEDEQGLACNCEGFRYRFKCRHVREVMALEQVPVYTSHKTVTLESLWPD
jgi:hypothetical protein